MLTMFWVVFGMYLIEGSNFKRGQNFYMEGFKIPYN